LSTAIAGGKKEIRDAIRRLPDGEIHWQKLQAAAYGPRIAEARLAEGATEFLKRCVRAGAAVYVISHKTEMAGHDETNTNLRRAAVAWMTSAGLLSPGGRGIDGVFFGGTRQEKIDHIRSLGCTCFVDDLEEVFLEQSFPAGVRKILYAPDLPQAVPPGIDVVRSWKQVGEYLFGAGT
jgi:hypothetical protein